MKFFISTKTKTELFYISLTLISITINLLHVSCVGIKRFVNFTLTNIIVIKPYKGNGIVILDYKMWMLQDIVNYKLNSKKLTMTLL